MQATPIQGPVLDFGVISDPTRVRATLEWLSLGPDARSVALAPTTLLHAPFAAVQVDPLGLTLATGDCLQIGPEPGRTRLGLRAAPGTALLRVGFEPV